MSDKKSKTAQLQLKITDAARKRILKFLRDSGDTALTPALLLNSSQKWNIGLYGQDQIEHLHDLYTPKGLVLLYEADGIEFCIPQPQLIAQLQGKTLDYQGDQYVVL